MVNRVKLPPSDVKITDPAYRSYLQSNNNALFDVIDTVNALEIEGISEEIEVTNGDFSDTVQIGLADNPIIPGTQKLRLPRGETGDRPSSPVPGDQRFNTTTGYFESYDGDWYNNIDWSAATEAFSTSGTVATGALTVTGAATISTTLGVTGALSSGAITCTTINQQGNALSNTGAITCTSLNATGGAITSGNISCGAITCVGISNGSNTISTGALTCTTINTQTNTITCGAIVASANISTTGAMTPSSIVVGSPTGGNKGAGTINATAVYDDNVLLTDFVFESDYKMLSIDEMQKYYETELHLPTIQGREIWEKEGKFSLGKVVNMLWETIEVQAKYITELNQRLKKVENSDS